MCININIMCVMCVYVCVIIMYDNINIILIICDNII